MRKSILFLLFVCMALIHLCAHLHPKVNAHVVLQSNFADVDKIVTWNIGYDFDLNMLWQALLNSAFAAVGIYWERCLGSNKPNPNNTQNVHGNLGKRIWPLRYRLLAAPWMLTLAASWIMNYAKLVLVFQHFSDSLLHMLTLYVRVQCLFIWNAVIAGVNYAGQLTGLLHNNPIEEQSFLSVVTDLLH